MESYNSIKVGDTVSRYNYYSVYTVISIYKEFDGAVVFKVRDKDNKTWEFNACNCSLYSPPPKDRV